MTVVVAGSNVIPIGSCAFVSAVKLGRLRSKGQRSSPESDPSLQSLHVGRDERRTASGHDILLLTKFIPTQLQVCLRLFDV